MLNSLKHIGIISYTAKNTLYRVFLIYYSADSSASGASKASNTAF